jgi:hypothetical protein
MDHPHQLARLNKVLLEKLLVAQLVKKFSTSYGIKRFITVKILSFGMLRCVVSLKLTNASEVLTASIIIPW